jgi:hypothetical protein
VNRLPRWRIAAAVAVLAALLGLMGLFAPIYFRNLELQNYVSDMTHRAGSQNQPDDVLRSQVLDKAHALDLPVREDDVHISRPPEGMRIDVRYFVRVDLPGYTVDLHFYPGAGSR